MTPMGRVTLGLVVVLVDIRIGSFDLLVEPVGWTLVLAGLVPLVARHTGLMAAAVAAGAGLVLSFFQVLAAPTPGPALVQSVAETVVVFSVCTALMALLAREPDRRAAGTIRWLEVGLLAVAATFYVLGPEETTDAGPWAVPVVLLVLAAIAVVVWFLVLLMRVRHEQVLQPAGSPGTAETTSP